MEQMNHRIRTIDLALIAVGAALIAVCSWITIPLPSVSFTMQTFAVFLILLLLGGRRGTLSVLVYLLLGAVGVPVFAGFTGGFGVLIGNNGGYLVGFLLMGVLYLAAERLLGQRTAVQIASLVLGLAVLYAFGTVWFLAVYTQANGAVGIGTVLWWCVIPFVLPDLAKLVLALCIARRVVPAVKGLSAR